MNTPERHQIVVVGGGPVGSALALSLHKQGRSVLLVDQGKASQKVCGEGLLPAAWSVLNRLGIAEFMDLRSPIRGLRYLMPLKGRPGRGLEMSADLHQPAFGVSRQSLMSAINTRLEIEEVPVLRETTLRQFQRQPTGLLRLELSSRAGPCSLHTEFLVGADGLHSKVRRLAGLDRPSLRRYSRWGCRVHFRSKEHLTDQVWVTLGDGIESYLTPVADCAFGLAFLWSPQAIGKKLRGEGPLWTRLLKRLPPFPFNLETQAFDFTDGGQAIGPLHQPVDSPLDSSRAVALVGDAAGYLDALTGEGMCLGLRQAELLSRLISEGRIEDYPREHRRLKMRHHLVVNSLLWLLEQPRLRERIFRALATCPRVFGAVISFAVEEAPIRVFANRELPCFLLRLLTGSALR